MTISLYDSDNKTLMRERRREIRLAEHNSKKKKGGKAERRETSFVFSFASCNCYYVGSYCVMVIVMPSVDE